MSSENLDVVFDTNIYISAVLFGGKPGDAYRMALRRDFWLSVSPAILKEVEECLQQKFFWDLEKTQAFIGQIKRTARLINMRKEIIGVCRDPEDDHVLSLAVQAKANFIFSGDKDLLTLKSYKNIQIVNTASFINIVRERHL